MAFLAPETQMISQTVEYALRAIVTIAQHDGEPCTAAKISAITKVPAPYLSKMMQGLVRAKIVTSRRGLHGGFVLTKAPTELTIWEVVDAVEPIQRIRQCPLSISSHNGELCPLHRRLDNAMAIVEEMLRDTTVAEVLAQPGSTTPLCEAKRVMMIETEADAKKSRGRAATAKRKKKQ